MEEIKVNVEKKVIYIALNKTTGLTDLVLQPYDEAGVAFGSPIAFTELTNGAYQAAFTPDALGTWRIRVSSVTNHDEATKAFSVVEKDISDVVTLIDAMDVKVDAIKTETDKIQSTKDEVITAQTKIDNVATDLAIVKANVYSGGYFA